MMKSFYEEIVLSHPQAEDICDPVQTIRNILKGKYLMAAQYRVQIMRHVIKADIHLSAARLLVGSRNGHGYIAIATSDLPAARAYLEEKGFAFDDSSVKRFPDGRILVIYSREEIGGCAIHLMQR